MAVPKSWGSKTEPYINASGYEVTLDRVPEPVRTYAYTEADQHLGFAGYMAVCNAWCMNKYGLGVYDFADQTWRDWYESQVTPADAVTQMANNEDLPLTGME